MKILFSCSKEMNTNNLVKRKNDLNFSEVSHIIELIKSVSEKDCYSVFKTKNNIYTTNQSINILSKKAIELYSGISFRQLNDLTNTTYDNVMILSALYGFSYAYDFVSPYRFDYSMNHSKKFRKDIYNKINEIISKEDVIYNLASKEFSTGIIHHNIIDFEFYHVKDDQLKQQSVASKKLRGQMLNFICENKKPDLKLFSYDDYIYCDNHSNSNLYVYIKEK